MKILFFNSSPNPKGNTASVSVPARLRKAGSKTL